MRRIAEALIVASPEPISCARLAEIIPGCAPAAARELVAELNEEYWKQDRAFEIWEVAGGYQVRTRAEFSGYLQQLKKDRPLRLSRAALETLAIVAYRQPATRAEVEEVRGVDAGAVLRGLLERQLLRLAGHREVPGRPILYATSKRFLEVFGLESLKGLPALRELDDLGAGGAEAGSGEEVETRDDPNESSPADDGGDDLSSDATDRDAES